MAFVRQFLFGPSLFRNRKSADDYDFMALSREIKKADRLEIVAWAARRGDCLVKYVPRQAGENESWNFHPLPSGAFCVSRTLRLPFHTQDDSFTHGLIIPPNLMTDFANNPVLIIEHLAKLGFWQAGTEVLQQLLLFFQETDAQNANRFLHEELNGKKYPVLRTISVDADAEPVRTVHLRDMAEKLGVHPLASILDAVLENVSAVVAGDDSPLQILKAIFDLFPVNCRTEFSFSTRLRFLPERPFRMIFTGGLRSEQKRIRESYHLVQVSVKKNAAIFPLKNRWSVLMADLLRQKWEGKWSETQILEPSPCEMDELPELAKRYGKMFGLGHKNMGKIEKSDKKTEKYHVFQDKMTDETWRQYLTSFLNIPQQNSSISPEQYYKAYLLAITGAAVGNPLAAEQFSTIRETLLKSVPEAERQDYSEKLLESGLQVWNRQKAEFPTRSYHQIEQMTDVLCAMIAEDIL